MPPQNVLFRCPRTGLMVQARIAEAADEADPVEHYTGTQCQACGGWHVINRKSGKLLAADEGQNRR